MLHPLSPRTTVATVILLLATVGLGGLLARPALAADVPWTVKTAANKFGADRESYGYTLNPGGTLEDGIVVVNDGAKPLHLDVHAADGATSPQGRLELVTKDAASKGVAGWARPAQGDVTVGAGESVEVPFAITLPKNAPPGDYVGGIVTSDASQRAGIQIRLRVGGALKPSLSVENVHLDTSTVTYTIHNTGNAILAARQTVKISGPFGRWKTEAGRIPDTPSLLPGEAWKMSAPLHDVTPALRLTATVTVLPLLTDAAGSTAPLAAIKTSGHAWAVPWALLLAFVVLCGLVVAGVAFRPRRRARALHG
jgi:WxL interacting protein linking bacterial and host surfaces